MKTVKDYLTMPYTKSIRKDSEGDFVARIEEFEGCSAHGETEEEALAALREVQEAWIGMRLGARLEIPAPNVEQPLPSGKWLQRVSRTLHKKLAEMAKREGVSLNHLVSDILMSATSAASASARPQRNHASRWEQRTMALCGSPRTSIENVINVYPMMIGPTFRTLKRSDVQAKKNETRHAVRA